MKRFGTCILLTFLLLLILNWSHLSLTAKAQNQDHVKGQILVKFKPQVTKFNIDQQLKSHQAKILDSIKALDVLIVKVPPQIEEKVVAALSKNPQVEFAELDYLAQALGIPNDPYFTNQWGLENTGQVIEGATGKVDADIDAPAAWDTTSGGVKVAILDSGIKTDHPDLSGQVVINQDFTNSASGSNDIYGHGTHVAGIVAALTSNNIGVAGGCPNCKLLNGKVLNDQGSGAYSGIANGINWAVENGAQVINLSLGGSAKSTVLEQVVNNAWKKGVVVVAAAGNSGNPSKTYPAAYTNVIAVASTNNKDQKANFSSYGSRWVDVAAPGETIFSTWKDSVSHYNPQPKCDDTGCYKFASGTSMSTPMVSAVAALVWTIPAYGTSVSAVRSRVESTADKISGTSSYWAWGRVNACKAVGGNCDQTVSSSTSTPIPTPTSTILTVSPTPTPTLAPIPTPTPTPQPSSTSLMCWFCQNNFCDGSCNRLNEGYLCPDCR